jgi:hypothetical protein
LRNSFLEELQRAAAQVVHASDNQYGPLVFQIGQDRASPSDAIQPEQLTQYRYNAGVDITWYPRKYR